jgi:DNA-directed RNA polymerase specialized sigma24 family protein
VLWDLVRARAAEKRGSGAPRVTLALIPEPQIQADPLDLIQTLDLLEQLRNKDSQAADVLELRLFGGLTNNEAAEVLHIGVATAGRHFVFARAWLVQQLSA